MSKTFTMKTLKYWRKKRKTLEDEKASHGHEWQNEYCENDYITKNDLQIQHNPNQNLRDILHRTRKINPKIHMEEQKTLNSQGAT